jgi:hypothetical protein
MRKDFLIYKKCVLVVLLILLMGGCAHDVRFDHIGLPFVVPVEKTLSIQDLDTNYRNYIKLKTPVRVMGSVKYQCQIRGAWAFIEQSDRLVFVDFASSSPNILLPTKRDSRPLIVEGLLKPDDTVLNKYRLVPVAFEYQR